MNIELTDVEKEQVNWLEKNHFSDFLKTLSKQFIEEIDQKTKDPLLKNKMYTPSMIKEKVMEARKEIVKEVQTSLMQQDWLAGLGLIIHYCKEDSEIHFNEWQSIPTAIEKLGKTDENPVDISFQEAIGLSNEAMGAAYLAAVKYYNLKDYTKALCTLSCITMFNSGFFNCWFLQGLCHQDLNEWSKAICSYSICVILNPSDPKPKYYLAYCHFQNNEDDIAEEFLTQAQAQDSKENTPPDFVEELIHSLHINQ